MKMLALSLALLVAAAGPALAEGDNPPPGLLAKIQIATQAHQDGMGSTKKVGSLNTSKLLRHHGDSARKADLTSANSPRTAIGGAIGNHASDGDED